MTPPPTIVNNYPVIERTVVQQAVGSGGISEDELTARLGDLSNKFAIQISNLENPGRESPLQNFVLPELINNLSNTTLNGDTKADNIFATYGSVGSLDVLGNTNVGGTFNAATTTLGTLSVSGNTLLSNATTTNFFAQVASTTNLFATNASISGALNVGSFNTHGDSIVNGNASTTGSGYFAVGLGVGVATSAPGVLQTASDAYIGGNLFVAGNSTTLGNSSSNTLVINSSIHSDIVPDQKHYVQSWFTIVFLEQRIRGHHYCQQHRRQQYANRRDTVGKLYDQFRQRIVGCRRCKHHLLPRQRSPQRVAGLELDRKNVCLQSAIVYPKCIIKRRQCCNVGFERFDGPDSRFVASCIFDRCLLLGSRSRRPHRHRHIDASIVGRYFCN